MHDLRILTDQATAQSLPFRNRALDSYTHLRNIIAYNIDESEKVLEEIHQSIDEKISATHK